MLIEFAPLFDILDRTHGLVDAVFVEVATNRRGGIGASLHVPASASASAKDFSRTDSMRLARSMRAISSQFARLRAYKREPMDEKSASRYSPASSTEKPMARRLRA